MITFTLDLEDHRSDKRHEKRYPYITRQILELLKVNSVQGTFFIVGTVAKEEPELIKEIAKQGHEIAFHSYHHKQLQYENSKQFLLETKIGKQELENITGQEVTGFRAPVFSLTRKTLWVLEILSDLGFKYSSSILPAVNPLNGFSEAPKEPFYWPNGILEIPVPVTRIGPVIIPFLGGVYLRYLPKLFLKNLINKNTEQILWTYCHPYDFDPNEPFFRIEGAGLITSLILWFNRSNTKEKMEFLLSLSGDENKSISFSEQYNRGVYKDYSTFRL